MTPEKIFSFAIDEEASEIELVADRWLLPLDCLNLACGLFLPGRTEPVIRKNTIYYQNGVAGFINDKSKIIADVRNEYGEIILPLAKTKKLLDTPTRPIRGIEIIAACVKVMLNSHAAWIKKPRFCCHAHDNAINDFLYPIQVVYPDQSLILEPVVALSYASQRSVPEEERICPDLVEERHQLLEHITYAMSGVQKEILDTLGKNHWIVHQFRMDNGTLYLERHRDYRINDWERRMASGEWKA
jgi:hypothetical protein